ncbi:MAG: TetR/AcrR family transcriptional regulator [Firmicutes bacterium]|nr:TetR/AcrR family transcriptional regulator [Bacillota bacterium]
MADTREKILNAALQLFARDGYEAVSVSGIASALGITKGALYRHYQNKRDIFDSIVRRMEERDRQQSAEHGVPEGTAEEMPDVYEAADPQNILAFSKAMFRYWTEDEFASNFRKMLTLEQFRSPEMGRLYQQYLVSGPVGYMADLFAAQNMPRPKELAVRFYAQMFLLYSVYDGTGNKKAALALMDDLLDRTAEQLAAEKKRGKNNGK